MSDEFFSAPTSDAPAAGAAQPVWELSGWWRRVGASVIDAALIYLPIGILFSILEEAAGFPEGLSILFQLALASIYFMWTMSKWEGQTVGKKVTGIRVVRESGQAVDAKFAFVRQILVIGFLFDTIAILFLAIPTILNYLWPLWDDKHQALHDKIVKSRVVRAEPVTDPGVFQAAQQQQAPVAPQFPVGTTPEAPAPTPPVAPGPPPPPPAPGPSTPYTPPPGFENPVPEDEK
jgi:uncharacterized RDD family membrane protein YckC